MKVYSKSIRIFLGISFEKNNLFKITDKQAHYLINVMRVKIGSEILVFNSFEGEYRVEIVDKSNNNITCQVMGKERDQEVATPS